MANQKIRIRLKAFDYRLIDKQNNVAASFDLFQNFLETLFEVTAVAATGDKCAEIE